MEIVFIVFSVFVVSGLIYYFFINDMIINKKEKKQQKKTSKDFLTKTPPSKNPTKSESYSKDYSLYDGDVKLSINKEESTFIKTIVRTHRIIKDEIPEQKVHRQTEEPKSNYEDQEIDITGSAFDSYEANLDHILSSKSEDSNIGYPNLEDVRIIKGDSINRNPVNVSDIIQNSLENSEEISKSVFDEVMQMRIDFMLNNEESDNEKTDESEILEEFKNNYEIFSDNKENILNFNPKKSNSNSTSGDNFLDFGNLEYDETV